MGTKGNKFVFLKPDEGSVSVRITVTDQLKAGGEFKLLKKDTNEILDVWKFNMDYKQPFEKVIKTQLKDMGFSALVWQILACSENPAVHDGAVKVEFFQLNKPCSVTVNSVSRFDSIAPCKFKSPVSYPDAITFVVKS